CCPCRRAMTAARRRCKCAKVNRVIASRSRRHAGELWRSRFDVERNLVVINNGHRDFVYAARNKTLKLRYICRLFAKELVLKNFVGIPPDQLLERLLELTLYTEENLR